MGLASFNRMRRSKKGVNVAEAERFKIDNEARNEGRRLKREVRNANLSRKEELRDLEHDANQNFAEKAIAGTETEVIDEPLRRDHAAEIAGRNIEGVQTPMDPVDRVIDRIPDSTANEELVGKTQVNMPGPSLEDVNAARREIGVREFAEGDTKPKPRSPDEVNAAKEEARERARQERLSRNEKARRETPLERSQVEIPADWEQAHGNRVKSIASQLTDEPITSKEQAEDVIRSELKRRQTGEVFE